MTSMWGSPVLHRVQAWRRVRNDPGQARFLTKESLRWVLRNRAYTPWYLVRYWRLLKFRIANPHIVLRGMVFLGKNVEIHARPGYGRMEIGRWVHIGDGNAIRCHEGSLRIGDKTVFGRQNVLNGYLDIEIGGSSIIADWVYVTDFDHVTTDINLPIKDQGIVKAPVRIGPDTWIGTKVSVLKGTRVGRGCVLGAHAVVRGDIQDFGIAVGAPARVVRDRRADYEADAERREAVKDMARKANEALQQTLDES
ncbi:MULTISPECIES: acyltransferase [Prauserella salsuginis group]|uniref:Acetyltransferase-like isoleucine patch superfamily enzyme n=2 Tax=Prauserella salsuginis group TaxID=2893672 RepID=A0A839XWX7_9PSEU|nr:MULTISPECIES: acyltransferase [Prauserella salsuginis group]MBB3665864.1 acetyltransferase-like isoleucine patch superfamily enzyme [Prauserella sediminis]MCR3718848.1 Acetyltransferase (isoleucine patch superfamily) [Prauserella flava]MCR3733418.1 Acetyltransferase (isoleucine patch superfamily) [Prauserella salsuginis]